MILAAYAMGGYLFLSGVLWYMDCLLGPARWEPPAEPETPRRYDDWLAEVEEIAARAWRSWTYGH